MFLVVAAFASTALSSSSLARTSGALPVTGALDRRTILAPALAAVLSGGLRPAFAADTVYKDSQYGDSFQVPAGWELSTNELSNGRKLVAAADPKEPDSNAFILYTPLAADYTSLGSFGNLDYVATTVLPTCGADRHFCSLANEGIQGELLESASVRGCYVYDYRIEQDRQPTRHLRTLFTIQLEEGRGKRLVTLTSQCLESRHAELAPTLKQIIDSYKSA